MACSFSHPDSAQPDDSEYTCCQEDEGEGEVELVTCNGCHVSSPDPDFIYRCAEVFDSSSRLVGRINYCRDCWNNIPPIPLARHRLPSPCAICGDMVFPSATVLCARHQ